MIQMGTHRVVGRRLRELRRSRDLSLAQVAAGTGISSSFLSLVEKGKSDITITRLMKLVHFFGTSVADLLPEHPSMADPIVVRAGERTLVELPGERIDVYLLAHEPRKAMMPTLNEYRQGGRMDEWAEHDGEEFVYALDGALLLEFHDGTAVTLAAGDSAYYRATVPHRLRNVGSGRARFIGVTTPPHL